MKKNAVRVMTQKEVLRAMRTNAMGFWGNCVLLRLGKNGKFYYVTGTQSGALPKGVDIKAIIIKDGDVMALATTGSLGPVGQKMVDAMIAKVSYKRFFNQAYGELAYLYATGKPAMVADTKDTGESYIDIHVGDDYEPQVVGFKDEGKYLVPVKMIQAA